MEIGMTHSEIKDFLDEKAQLYNHPKFVESDPIQIPHRFSKKEDIEIAAFLTATIAWGNRKSIIHSANLMMAQLHESPHDFILQAKAKDFDQLEGVVHRTFQAVDFRFFLKSLKRIYETKGGLETALRPNASADNYFETLHHFHQLFFEDKHQKRTRKHLADPLRGSAAKRMHMFLRWMVRKDHAGVDFGIWNSHSPSQLSCPLDVHTGNVARALGLINRKQNDAKALQELDQSLRKFDSKDPVRYDFALFGLGVFEKFT